MTWLDRIGIGALLLMGVALIVAGLWPRKRRPALRLVPQAKACRSCQLCECRNRSA